MDIVNQQEQFFKFQLNLSKLMQTFDKISSYKNNFSGSTKFYKIDADFFHLYYKIFTDKNKFSL